MKGWLIFEVPNNGLWVALAGQSSDTPPGTICDNHANGRDVYVTQVFADHATIKRLPGSIHEEVGIHRVLNGRELARALLVRRLEHGESHEMTLKPDMAPRARTFRYRFVRSA